MNRIENLETEQLAATSPNKSAWVSAHAGSGKTYILINRFVRLLLEGVHPENILCLTFTKAASAEMSLRLYQKLGEWALCDEEKLHAELEELEGVAPNEERIKKARNLFYLLLEAQNGSKVQTIHAFCQSILNRFPIEAGIYPNFQVMDEYATNAMLKEARMAVLNNAVESSSEMKIITQNIDAAGFEKIFSEITKKRKLMEVTLYEYPKKLDKLKRNWGIAQEENHQTIRNKIILERPQNLMLQAVDAMRKYGGPSFVNLADIIDKNINNELALSFIDNYIDVFFTSTGEPRKKLVNKEISNKMPKTEKILIEEQARIGGIIEKANMVQAIEFANSFAKLAATFLKVFAHLKEQKGFLDYDDLIHKTLALFKTQEVADWVLYRLDSKIDHILIDEAQDTNPEQWQLIEKLSEEFFSGIGYKEQLRSLFVVGDAKQSIFGFQGAAPDDFAKQQKFFFNKARAGKVQWAEISLAKSFRAAPQLLSFIDRVFAELPLNQVFTKHPPHQAHRTQADGKIEAWDLFSEIKDKEGFEIRADRHLAITITAKISSLLDKGANPKDILILVRRRNDFVDMLIDELKKQNLPIAGSDRLVLGENLAIKDLIALARFVLLPQDDLSLAEILKSPFANLNEDDLMSLAINRGNKSLWEVLSARASEFPKLVEFLNFCLRRADFVPVFEFFSEILEVKNMRGNFAYIMGEDIHDPLDAFLNLTLTYEKTHTSNLQSFVEWFAGTQAEIKRDMERGLNEIRIMTIHGAKGLESKIVFFVDIPPTTPRDYFLPIDNIPFLRLPNIPISKVEIIKEKKAKQNDFEENRLLYVALTRACDQLYVCGYKNRGNQQPKWLNTIAKKIEGKTIPQPKEISQTTPSRLNNKKPSIAPPIWISKKFKTTKNERISRSPSSLSDSTENKKTYSVLESKLEESPAKMRGTILHQALQFGKGLNHSQLTKILENKFDNHQASAELAQQAINLINNKDLAEIFDQGLNEIPIKAVFGIPPKEVIFSGKIDRLILDSKNQKAIIIDYKSDAEPKAEMPEIYKKQLSAYCLMLERIYPNWDLRAAILWTAEERLDWLSNKSLENLKKELISTM